jgi:hypothetical protein
MPHRAQLPWPSAEVYAPAAQSAQVASVVARVAAEALPLRHGVQEAWPDWDWYVPAPQPWHVEMEAAAVAAENVPARQSVQVSPANPATDW